MKKIIEKLVEFLKCEVGVTAIEYALIAFLIATVIIVALTAVSNELSSLYTHIAAEVAHVIN